MNTGKTHKSGDVVLAQLQFTDTFTIKKRPAVILFQERGNIVVAGITSNTHMQGVSLSTKDGIAKPSVVKVNYLFSIAKEMIVKELFHLPKHKKKEVYEALDKRLSGLL